MKRVSLVVLLLACVGTLAPGGEDAKVEPKPRKDAAVVAPEDAVVHRALEKRVSFDFVNTPLADVAAFLSGILKVSLVVDPEVPKDTTLSLKAKDMKAAHAVSWVAEAAGGRMVVERGAVYIGPADDEQRKKPLEDDDPDTLRVKEALGKKISFDFVETPLGDVVSFLSTAFGAAIVLDHQIPRDATVTLKVTDMKGGSALHWVAKLVGGEVEVRQGAAFIRNVKKRHTKEKGKERLKFKPGEKPRKNPEHKPRKGEF